MTTAPYAARAAREPRFTGRRVNEYCRQVGLRVRLALGALLLGGCAHATLPAPAVTLRALADALAGADPRAARALLADSVRAQVGEQEFAAAFRASARERANAAVALRSAADHHDWKVHAEVDRGAQLASLVSTEDGWQLESPRFSGRGATTPREALLRFTAALESRDLDALLRILGDPLAGIIERELSERLAGLRAAADKSFEIEGDSAKLRYDARHHLELRRENGLWRIVDFN
jgi:hypothetical protein